MGDVLPFPKRRRRHPRTEIRQPVALVHGNGTVATVLGINVSLGGLQVICDRYTLDTLLPCRTLGRSPVGTPIDAHFKLPLSAGMAKLDLGCRVAYIAQAEPPSFLVGLEFARVTAGSRETLEAFLEEALAFDLA